MASHLTTRITNYGPRRRVAFVPPSGRVMNSLESVAVDGLLEELLIHGNHADMWNAYLDDLARGWVELTYDFGDAAVVIPVTVLAGLNRTDKRQRPLPSGWANHVDTGLDIAQTPEGDSYVMVTVNGVEASMGDGVRTRDFYFSADGGLTAKPLAAVMAGDSLYFNALVAQYPLEVSDEVSLHYVVQP